MTEAPNSTAAENGLPAGPARALKPWIRHVGVILEVGLAAGLIAWWLSSTSLHQSRNLWVLFLYCFPSEFLISVVPHEPVILYFGQFAKPLAVAAISVAGTALTEVLNYVTIRYFADFRGVRRLIGSASVQRIVAGFRKAPFPAILTAGFLPVPFYPIRFLVVAAHYPLPAYIAGVVISRAPRFYLLALLGRLIRFRPYQLLILAGVLILALNFPFLARALGRKRGARPPRAT
jgi:membrane protein YqaA with SNARE-associated domain